MFIYLGWLTIFIISPLLVANDNSQFIEYSMKSGGVKTFIFNSREGTERIVLTKFQAPSDQILHFTFLFNISCKSDGKEKMKVYYTIFSVRNCSTPSNDAENFLKRACQFKMPVSLYAVTNNVAYLQICSFGITEFGIFIRIHSQGKFEGPKDPDSKILSALQSRRINLDGCGKGKNHLRYPGNENGLNLQDRSLIIGGQEAKPHSYPWMVHLVRIDQKACGGALLNNEWVLTAGHCVTNDENRVFNQNGIIIFLGAHSFLGTDPKENVKKCSASKIIVHKNFSGHLTLYYDIALIKINCSVTYSETISPICLPTNPDDDLNEYDNIDVILAGWGHVADKSINPNPSMVLKEAFVKTNSNFKLMEIDGSYEYRMYLNDQDSNVCPGDSGGPMMFYDKDNEHFIQYGVNSGLIRNPDQPEVDCAKELVSFFVFVPKYLKWIIENIDA